MTLEIQDFLALMKDYTLLLFDVVGVIHNGVDALPHAIEAINAIPPDKRVIFLSNMPRPGTQVREKLIKFGVTRSFDVLTSGDVTRELLLTTYVGKKIYHWGTERNTDITVGLSLNFVEQVEESEVVLLTAFLKEGEDEAINNGIMHKIVQRKIPVICANPDKIAMHGDTTHKCAGYIADKILAEGGQVIFIGKPNPLIYKIILEKFSFAESSKVLMIGDTIETDIKGAKQAGISSLLVFTGNTGNELRR